MPLFKPRCKLPLYEVTLALSGHHPYLPRQDFPDSTATVHVHAKSWNDAVKQATKGDVLDKLTFWSARVVKIERPALAPKEGT